MTADDKDDESVTDKVCWSGKERRRHSKVGSRMACLCVLMHGMVHSFIIIREVLILTLSIFISLYGLILGNTALGTVFLNTLPNIRNTSLCGKH